MPKIEQLCGSCLHLRPGLESGFTCAAPVPYWVHRQQTTRDVEPELGHGCEAWTLNAIERCIRSTDRQFGLGE